MGIKVLLIEDDDSDAELLRVTLSRQRTVLIEMQRVDRLSSAFELLATEPFDVVLSDLGLPDSQGLDTFMRIHDRHPDISIIVLSGLKDEEIGIKAVQCGAQDYLVKGQVDANLLVRSMRYAIERQKLLAQLEKSLKEIKTLEGLIPMCAWCGKIRDDKGFWTRVETYIRQRTGAAFTHGICPECVTKIDPDVKKE